MTHLDTCQKVKEHLIKHEIKDNFEISRTSEFHKVLAQNYKMGYMSGSKLIKMCPFDENEGDDKLQTPGSNQDDYYPQIKVVDLEDQYQEQDIVSHLVSDDSKPKDHPKRFYEFSPKVSQIQDVNVTSEDARTPQKSYFLASVIDEEDKSNHGRIYAFPAFTDTDSEPFEILYKKDENGEREYHYLQDLQNPLQNIEIYLLDDKQAIITGIKQLPKPKSEGQFEQNLMIYQIDIQQGLKSAKISAVKKEHQDLHRQSNNEYNLTKGAKNDYFKRSAVIADVLFTVPQHDQISAMHIPTLKTLSTKELNDVPQIKEIMTNQGNPTYQVLSDQRLDFRYSQTMGLNKQKTVIRAQTCQVGQITNSNQRALMTLGGEIYLNQTVRYIEKLDSNSHESDACEKSLVVLYFNKEVLYINLDYDEAKGSYDFRVIKKAVLKFERPDTNSDQDIGMLEKSGFMACYKDEKIFYNLNKSTVGSMIFNKKGNAVLKLLDHNIYPVIFEKNKLMIYDKKNGMMNKLVFDKFTHLKNDITKDIKNQRVKCLSNIYTFNKDTVFLQSETGDFGEYDFGTKKFQRQKINLPGNLEKCVFRQIVQNKDFVVINVEPGEYYTKENGKTVVVQNYADGHKKNMIIIITKDGKRQSKLENKNQIERIFLTNENYLIMKADKKIHSVKLTKEDKITERFVIQLNNEGLFDYTLPESDAKNKNGKVNTNYYKNEEFKKKEQYLRKIGDVVWTQIEWNENEQILLIELKTKDSNSDPKGNSPQKQSSQTMLREQEEKHWVICLDQKLQPKKGETEPSNISERIQYNNKNRNQNNQQNSTSIYNNTWNKNEQRFIVKGQTVYFLQTQAQYDTNNYNDNYCVIQRDPDSWVIYNKKQNCQELQVDSCFQMHIAIFEECRAMYIVCFHTDNVKILSWGDWKVILQLEIPFEIDIKNCKNLCKQHPTKPSVFLFGQFKFDIKNLFEGINENGFSLFCMKKIIKDEMQICPGTLEYFKKFCHLPSKFNILSLLVGNINDNDHQKVIPYLKSENYPLLEISDEAGFILNQMLSKQLFKCRNELGNYYVDNKIRLELSQDDLTSMLKDSTPFITDLIVNNCEKLSIYKYDSTTGWHQKKEQMLGTIVEDGEPKDLVVFTANDKIVTQEDLEQRGLVNFPQKKGKANDSSQNVTQALKNQEPKLIEIISSPLKFNKLGSKRLGDFFEAFLHPEINSELAFDTVIKEYIDHFWNKHLFKISKMLYMTRLLPLLVQNLLLVLPHEATLITNLILSVYLFIYEVVQMIKLGPTEHFENKMNIFDMIGHSAGIIWVSCILALNFSCHEDLCQKDQGQEDQDQEEQFCSIFDQKKLVKCVFERDDYKQLIAKFDWLHFMNIIWTFTITIRATDLFSIIMDDTRQLFAIIKISARDIIPFMIITIYIFYVFAVIKQFQAYSNGDQSVSFLEQTGVVVSESLGGFDTPGIGKERVVGAWVIFLMLQTVTAIIVLNTLIAILGDSYDSVMTEQTAYDMRQKVELLKELNDLMMDNSEEQEQQGCTQCCVNFFEMFLKYIIRDKNTVSDSNKLQYIIVVRYLQNNQNIDAWEGKIKMVLKEIRKVSASNQAISKMMKMQQTAIENQIEQIDDKIDSKIAQVDTKITQLDSKIEQRLADSHNFQEKWFNDIMLYLEDQNVSESSMTPFEHLNGQKGQKDEYKKLVKKKLQRGSSQSRERSKSVHKNKRQSVINK